MSAYIRPEVGDPRESELGRLESLLLCELIELIDEFEVLVELLALEPGAAALEGSLGDILG